jgi:hypothetical protein
LYNLAFHKGGINIAKDPDNDRRYCSKEICNGRTALSQHGSAGLAQHAHFEKLLEMSYVGRLRRCFRILIARD